jgi:hypothetical protein
VPTPLIGWQRRISAFATRCDRGAPALRPSSAVPLLASNNSFFVADRFPEGPRPRLSTLWPGSSSGRAPQSAIFWMAAFRRIAESEALFIIPRRQEPWGGEHVALSHRKSRTCHLR